MTNQQKARAHLARAQELLSQGTLAFGVKTEETKTKLDELPNNALSQIMESLDLVDLDTMRPVSQNIAKAVRDSKKHVLKQLQSRLLIHHAPVSSRDDRPWSDIENNCIKALSEFCGDRLKEHTITTTPGIGPTRRTINWHDRLVLFIRYVEPEFQSLFHVEPRLSAIDFVRMCVIKYPSPYSFRLIWILNVYLHSDVNYKKHVKSTSCEWIEDEYSEPCNQFSDSELNDIIDMIEYRHRGYKSSVRFVSCSALEHELITIENCRKTLLVSIDGQSRQGRWKWLSCLFVDASAKPKRVFILDHPPDLYHEKLQVQLLGFYNKNAETKFYHLDNRIEFPHINTNTGNYAYALAIEDSIRLFYKSSVPHLPDYSRPDTIGLDGPISWNELPVNKVEHAPGSHLLAYSELLSLHKMRIMLGENSPYIWFAPWEDEPPYKNPYPSCLIGTYHCLYKLEMIKNAEIKKSNTVLAQSFVNLGRRAQPFGGSKPLS